MKEQVHNAEEMVVALFEGRDRREQMALMVRLERTGGSLYRIWAESERNAKAREKLMEAAEREESNAELLRLMTSPKSSCERCQCTLALDAPAYCCSFQCTFCPECAVHFAHACPNWGGELNYRPAG